MKALKYLLNLLAVFGLFSCSQSNVERKEIPKQEVPVNHSYDEVKEYELFWETMFDVNSNDYYVYFYSETCNHCEELKDYIIEKALVKKNIYFVKGSSKDQIGNDPKKSKYAENPGDIWILGYPSLIEIIGHKCMKNLAGISQIKSELK